MFRKTLDVATACKEFLEDVQRIWDGRLESVLLYGSAARDDFHPGRSDLNLLVVTDELDPEILRQVQPLTRKWRRRRIATPLFLSKGMITSSLDSYPLEFLSMAAAYRLLHGEDVLAGLTFQKEHVRLQCERELKSKLLLLRQNYIESAGSRELLHDLIFRSIPSLTAIFQGMLYLQDRPWKVWGEDLLSSCREAFGLDAELFRTLKRVRRGEIRPKKEELHGLMTRYIREVARLADWVDKGGLAPGGPAS
jgi:predicted nucleotidyltransferase